MKTIYKYEIPTTDEYELTLPIESTILNVISIDNSIFLYALIDTNEKLKSYYTINIYGTGFKVDLYLEKRDYIGTVQMFDGKLIWHVFAQYKGEDPFIRKLHKLGE